MDRTPREGGIHPQSPGALAAAARVGTQGAPVPNQPSRHRVVSARSATRDERQIVLRFFSGAAALTRARQPEQTPASCRPIRVGAQYADGSLAVGLLAAKTRSPLKLSGFRRVSTGGQWWGTGGDEASPFPAMSSPSDTDHRHGGGGFSMEPDNPLTTTSSRSLGARSRASASSDARAAAPGGRREIYRAFSQQRCEPMHLPMLTTPPPDAAHRSGRQDVFLRRCGSTRNLLAWREWGLIGSSPANGAEARFRRAPARSAG